MVRMGKKGEKIIYYLLMRYKEAEACYAVMLFSISKRFLRTLLFLSDDSKWKNWQMFT